MTADYLKDDDVGKKAKGNDFKKWFSEVTIAEKDQKPYIKRAKNVVKRYRDEDRGKNSKDEDLPARYAILWSNTETLGPALYSHAPHIQVDRRFKDSDPLGRVACQIWERATQFSIDTYDFNSVMRAVIKDYLLASRGTAWVRYEPMVSDDRITYQEVSCDHVHFTDFLHASAKQWRQVRWVGRKVYLNRRQLVDRFGKKIGSKVGLDYSPKEVEDEDSTERDADDQDEFKQARIYEIWDSETMEVIWLSKSYPDNILDKQPDPLGLHDFYPTPKPLFGTTSTETCVPIPDYCLYQDQARELDQITMKIALLTDSLRRVGFHDATYNKELKDLFEGTAQNEMIPIANWQKLQAAGGIKGVAEWMELDQVIQALTALYADRDKVKQDLYEISGIGDIIRGSNSGLEVTATEQRIKGQFATLRLKDRKNDVERYARDLCALQGEIIAEHFEPEIIAAMSGYDVSNPDVQQQFMPAVELLKNDPVRSFRLTLETDSMVAIDESQDKQDTTEFVTAMGGFLQSALQVLQGAPVLAPLMGETMMFMSRRYNAGRGLEAAIEQGMQGLAQMAQQALTQPPPPDPATIKAQSDIQLAQQKAQNEFQLNQSKAQQEAALNQQDAQVKAQMHAQEMQGRMTLAQQEAQQSMFLAKQKLENEIQLAREKAAAELQIKIQELQAKNELDTKQAILKSGIPDLHVTPKGQITTKPTIVKEGGFFNDPVTGQRRVRIIEKPLEEEEAAV